MGKEEAPSGDREEADEHTGSLSRRSWLVSIWSAAVEKSQDDVS